MWSRCTFAIGPKQADDMFEQHAFPAAARSDYSGELPFGKIQIHSLQSRDIDLSHPVDFGQTVGLNQSCGCHPYRRFKL